MPRDGGGTENIQTSANEAAVKNKIYKHLQRRFFAEKRVKSDFQFLSL